MRKLCFLIFSLAVNLFAQIENVPISHRVYDFLKRMEVRGLIRNFDDASLPISRKEVADFLIEIYSKRDALTESERGFLELMFVEFEKEIENETANASGILNDVRKFLSGIVSDRAKYLYFYSDSIFSFYSDFLFKLDLRRSGQDFVSLAEIGGRLRGAYDGKLGFYLESTDGQSFGSKELALKDLRLKQNYKFNEPGAVNFDFTQAYVKFQTKNFSFQIGREHIVQGYGQSGKLFISKTAPIFDFLKIRFKYRGVSYDFIHSWLLGERLILQDTLVGKITFVNSKFLAAHRLNINFFDRFNFGVWEGVIYTGRFPELAYLNPFNFFKSAEHSLQDRDNALLGFDFKSNIFKNFQIYGTLLVDDIHFGRLGSGWYGNQLGYQIGFYLASIARNIDLIFEYTRIEPYVYSHRLRDNNYTSDGFLLGHEIGPNSDDFFVKILYLLSKRVFAGLSLELIRHGRNFVDANNDTINVGGDYNLGHRVKDSENVRFLDGVVERMLRARADISYELFKDFFFELGFELTRGSGNFQNEFITFFKIKIDY